MHKLCSGLCRSNRKVSRAERIDLIVQIKVLFCRIHCGVCGAVDNRVRLHFPCKFQNLIYLCYIEFRYIRINQVVVFPAAEKFVDCYAQLTVTSGDNDILHKH